MTETPFFFPNASYNLFGVLHEPENQPNRIGFVFCSPFAEEKLWAHRVFVNFARELARLGYHVLRFDYMGHGDSEGDFQDSTIETRLSDIRCAVGTLKSRSPHTNTIGLVGLRLGASLASLVAENEDSIAKLILWDPIFDGAQYMREQLRINLATQVAMYREIRHDSKTLIEIMREGGTVNIEGYEIGWPFYEQTGEIRLLDAPKSFRGEVLLVQIKKRPGKVNDKLETLKGLYSSSATVAVVEEQFWKEIKFYYPRAENLFQATLDWLEGT